MNTTRPYTMTARARAVEEARARIIDACVACGERPVTDIALDDVAGRAGVSVRPSCATSAAGAAWRRRPSSRPQQVVTDERRSPVGDVSAAVRVIVDHYEQRGDQAC